MVVETDMSSVTFYIVIISVTMLGCYISHLEKLFSVVFVVQRARFGADTTYSFLFANICNFVKHTAY